MLPDQTIRFCRVSLLAVCCAVALSSGCGEADSTKDASKANAPGPAPTKTTVAKDTKPTDKQPADKDTKTKNKDGTTTTPPTDPVEQLIHQRKELDQTVFKSETLAQEHEGTFIKLWDDLRNKEPFGVLRGLKFSTITWAEAGPASKHERDITLAPMNHSPRNLTREQAVAMLNQFEAAGWAIGQTEWHHSTFHPAKDNQPARSEVSIVINVEHAATQTRAALKGSLFITWSGDRDEITNPIIASIDASKLSLMKRTGDIVFKPWFTSDPRSDHPKAHPRSQPVIVYDLDNDGLNDVITAGCNLIWRNKGNGKFEKDMLCLKPKDIAECGVIADFNDDGHADLAVVHFDRKVYIFYGDGSGTFKDEAHLAFADRIEMPTVLTAGDIDGDGDQDLFIGQYELPYQKGQMPTPYYDANDGFPAFLLENDGQGKFKDITETNGLGPKRHRRTFRASFVDLDDDNDLDLVVTNDFAGLDAYLNDGQGKFTDVSDTMFDKRHAFGMAHTFGDYNVDGKLDFYMVGMSSTTARRLHRMGVGRKEFADRDEKRMEMTYGNRLYVREGDKYVHAPFAPDTARMGWAWGTSSVDFDNDGDEDLYVANGHISGKSSKDYCTRYWCHDIYTGSSYEDKNLRKLFGIEVGQTHNMDISWNGYEKNALLMNEKTSDGRRFHNIGWLMGVSFEYDARAVVTDDLDNDGRMDLIVVQNWGTIGKSGTVVHVYRNHGITDGNWIGVRLQEEKGGTPIGARLSITTKAGQQVRRIVTGDSYSSQHSLTKHFGLGDLNEVSAIEVQWLNGRKARIDNPAINRYHVVRMPVIHGR